jgi:DNA-binding transcriptional regulator YiaG
MPDTERPSAAEIKAARKKANLTQAEAAELVHALERSWRYWEAGSVHMPTGLWELFLIKIGAREARA